VVRGRSKNAFLDLAEQWHAKPARPPHGPPVAEEPAAAAAAAGHRPRRSRKNSDGAIMPFETMLAIAQAAPVGLVLSPPPPLSLPPPPPPLSLPPSLSPPPMAPADPVFESPAGSFEVGLARTTARWGRLPAAAARWADHVLGPQV
jgi:hypothetical protein